MNFHSFILLTAPPPIFFSSSPHSVCHCALAEKEIHGLFLVWDPRMKHFSNRLALYPHNEVYGFEEAHFPALKWSTKSEWNESSFSWLRQFHKTAPRESVQLLRDWSCRHLCEWVLEGDAFLSGVAKRHSICSCVFVHLDDTLELINKLH